MGEYVAAGLPFTPPDPTSMVRVGGCLSFVGIPTEVAWGSGTVAFHYLPDMKSEAKSDRPSIPADDRPASGAGTTRAGYVALAGPPNVGKSTLMNRILGQAISIVTPKAQTTWRKVAGILTRADAQLIFLDTPGLLEPRNLMHRALMTEAHGGMKDADVLVLMVDGTRDFTGDMSARFETLGRQARVPVLGVINKMDQADPEQAGRQTGRLEAALGSEPLRVSAETGDGVEEFLDRVIEVLPESPFLYPEDEVAIDPVRFFVSELVRETVFEQFEEEVPYATFTRTEDFRQASEGDRTYIQVTIYVERPSQKGILIGEGGRAIRNLGTLARAKIEHFLGESVYLELWVKVLPRWRKKKDHLRRLGFSVPRDDTDS